MCVHVCMCACVRACVRVFDNNAHIQLLKLGKKTSSAKHRREATTSSGDDEHWQHYGTAEVGFNTTRSATELPKSASTLPETLRNCRSRLQHYQKHYKNGGMAQKNWRELCISSKKGITVIVKQITANAEVTNSYPWKQVQV